MPTIIERAREVSKLYAKYQEILLVIDQLEKATCFDEASKKMLMALIIQKKQETGNQLENYLD